MNVDDHTNEDRSAVSRGSRRQSSQRPQQPWLHDLAITVDGNVTALSRADGTMAGVGAEGLFVDDERVLSVLRIEVGDTALVHVASASSGGTSEFVASARHLGNDGPDPTVEVHRRRDLVRGGLVETVSVTSRADAAVVTDVVVIVGGDGASVGAVKSGLGAGPLASPVVEDGGHLTWRTAAHDVRVVVAPRPELAVEADGTTRGRVAVSVPPGGTATVTVTVHAERTVASLFDADPGSHAVDWPAEVFVEAGDPRLARVVNRSLVDLQHLLLVDPDAPEDIFAAAGTPWYLTLFGRDSIWTARLALPIGTRLAAGTLRALARRQGAVVALDRAEAPGKIPHELRRTEDDEPGHAFSLPPIYYGTVDATALWMCLLHDAWRWGMPEQEVKALLPNLRAAAGWLTCHAAPDADGLLKYVDESGHGLVNQGWKDSGDSIRWRDGRIAAAPMALVEAQAYAVEAAVHTADLLDALGDHSGSGGSEVGKAATNGGDRELSLLLREFAADLVARVRGRFWVGNGDRQWLAMAIDGHGRAVDGIGSNMGHVLGTGTLTPAEAGRVADMLTDPRMLRRYGIATLSSDNGGFNPIGYHTGSVWTHDSAICALGLARENQLEAAASVVGRLLDVAEAFHYRFPELFADTGVLDRPAPYPASCRPQAWSSASAIALLSVTLGLDADVPGRTFTVRPNRFAPFGAVTLRGIRVGEHRVSVAVSGDGGVCVEGLPQDFTLLR
jgi:glycogen debranching enzyme